jgi:hypothetical protein
MLSVREQAEQVDAVYFDKTAKLQKEEKLPESENAMYLHVGGGGFWQ